jgi:hypothetical protein
MAERVVSNEMETLEGSGGDVMEVLSRHLPEGTGKKPEIL